MGRMIQLADKPITTNSIFSNPIFDDEIKKDSNEGATAYPCDKLPDIPENEPGMGYNNTVCENDYSELFLRSKSWHSFRVKKGRVILYHL